MGILERIVNHKATPYVAFGIGIVVGFSVFAAGIIKLQNEGSSVSAAAMWSIGGSIGAVSLVGLGIQAKIALTKKKETNEMEDPKTKRPAYLPVGVPDGYTTWE